MDWLDTETKASLQRSPPKKLAPPNTATFTVVLLAVHGHNRPALVRAVQRAAQVSADEATSIVSRPLPAQVKKGLTYLDGQIAQFELIACDAISVIIPDEVVATGSAHYLAELYSSLQNIDEFETVPVRVEAIPDDPKGQAFCEIFFGGQKPTLPAVVRAMRKKARIMQHWAEKIGGHVTVVQ
jgi:hypothetical protein